MNIAKRIAAFWIITVFVLLPTSAYSFGYNEVEISHSDSQYYYFQNKKLSDFGPNLMGKGYIVLPLNNKKDTPVFSNYSDRGLSKKELIRVTSDISAWQDSNSFFQYRVEMIGLDVVEQKTAQGAGCKPHVYSNGPGPIIGNVDAAWNSKPSGEIRYSAFWSASGRPTIGCDYSVMSKAGVKNSTANTYAVLNLRVRKTDVANLRGAVTFNIRKVGVSTYDGPNGYRGLTSQGVKFYLREDDLPYSFNVMRTAETDIYVKYHPIKDANKTFEKTSKMMVDSVGRHNRYSGKLRITPTCFGDVGICSVISSISIPDPKSPGQYKLTSPGKSVEFVNATDIIQQPWNIKVKFNNLGSIAAKKHRRATLRYQVEMGV